MRPMAMFVLFSLLALACTLTQTAALPTPAPATPTAFPSVPPRPDVSPTHLPPTLAVTATSPAGMSTAALKLEWSKDAGTRVSDGSVPYVYRLKDGRFRLYYCSGGGILSAISADGLYFEKEPGGRIAPTGGQGSAEAMVCDPSVIDLPDGRIRMYYKGATGPGGPGQARHKIFSAISSDGLSFQKEGLRIDSEKTNDDGWASVPEAIRLRDGRVRIYYVSNAKDVGHGIVSAISSDGLNFTKEETKLTGFVDPAVTILPDGKYLLLALAFPFGQGEALSPGFYSFISEDGIHFASPQPVLLENGIFDPAIVRLDDGSYRVFYGAIPPGESQSVKSITGRARK